MDEMLIHTFRDKMLEDLCLFGLDKSQYLKFISQGRKLTCAKRPGVEQFLLEMSKHFILIPWTAGTEEYATPILDWLDPDGSLFKFRLFRHHCVTNDGGESYVKDLKALNVSLSRVLILDNNPRSYQNQQDNGVPIINFEGDQLDCELRSGSYIEVLTQASKFADVRKAITADLRLMVETKRTEVVSIHLNVFWDISFSRFYNTHISHCLYCLNRCQ
jgi:Dullard-like phosphatase family protein